MARIGATVLKEDLLRVDGLPFVTRLPGMPVLPRGQRVELDILGGDEIELSLEARLHQVLTAIAVPEDELDPEEDGEANVQADTVPLAPGSTQAPQPSPPEGNGAPASNQGSGVAP